MCVSQCTEHVLTKTHLMPLVTSIRVSRSNSYHESAEQRQKKGDVESILLILWANNTKTYYTWVWGALRSRCANATCAIPTLSDLRVGSGQLPKSDHWFYINIPTSAWWCVLLWTGRTWRARREKIDRRPIKDAESFEGSEPPSQCFRWS